MGLVAAPISAPPCPAMTAPQALARRTATPPSDLEFGLRRKSGARATRVMGPMRVSQLTLIKHLGMQLERTAIHFFFVVIALLLAAPQARAQIQIIPPPAPASLTNISVAENGETRIVLTFDPQSPKFSLIGNAS